MEWEEKIIGIQNPSTQAAMRSQNLRKSEDDWDYISSIKNTKIALTAQCVKEDGTVDLNVREFTNQEVSIEEGLRQARGEIIQGLRAEQTNPTLTEEKRERGANAFMRAISVDALKHKFKNIMKDLFKPTLAEVIRKKHGIKDE